MTKLGKYELVRPLGAGGMAELFVARQQGVSGFQKTVVIKRLRRVFANDPEVVSMFVDEARIAARLSHPNIVNIFDLGESDGDTYIAMEYVSGRDLAQVVEHLQQQGKAMPHPVAAHIARCICWGLHHAHTATDDDGQPLNIVHRGVSPHNVLLSFDGDVKLTDFGMARAASRAAQTRAGVLKGKVGYMSPEQVEEQPVDARSDLFSAATILYELVCNRKLFIRDSDFATMGAVISDPIPPPSALRDDVPDELESVMLRGLARKPEQRFPSAVEMHQALDRAMLANGWTVEAAEVGQLLQDLRPSSFSAVDTDMSATGLKAHVAGRIPSLSPAASREPSDDPDELFRSAPTVISPEGDTESDDPETVATDTMQPQDSGEMAWQRAISGDDDAVKPQDTDGLGPPTMAVPAGPGAAGRRPGGPDTAESPTVAVTPPGYDGEAPGSQPAAARPLDAATTDETTSQRTEAWSAPANPGVAAPPPIPRPPPIPGPAVSAPAGPAGAAGPASPVPFAPASAAAPPATASVGAPATTAAVGPLPVATPPRGPRMLVPLLVVGGLAALSVVGLFVWLGAVSDKPDTAVVEVRSQPGGATVYLDAKKRFGVTPLTMYGVTVGQPHRVVVSLEGHEPWDTSFTIKPGQERHRLTTQLRRIAPGGKPGTLKVSTRPSGAQIFFDGELQGRAPLTIERVEAGVAHRLVAKGRGLADTAVELMLQQGESRSVQLELKPPEEPLPQGVQRRRGAGHKQQPVEPAKPDPRILREGNIGNRLPGAP